MHSKTCPICDGPSTARKAIISPFIVERCNLETAETLIRYCASCDFAFFDRRLSPEEAAALYTGYRGEAYNAQRLRLEPSYAPYVTLFEDQTSPYYRSRLADLFDVLAVLPEIRPSSVLDFGGDGRVAARLFPYTEISFLDASAGEKLQRDRFGLILASQVFEHLTDPREAIARIAAMLDDSGILVLDLPRDYDGALSEALAMHEGQIVPINVMHEHINHFSPRSIRRLLGTAGIVPVFEVQTPSLPLMLTIAGRADAPLVRQLLETAPQRLLQWTAERIRARQEGDLAESASRLSAAQADAARLAGELAAMSATLAATSAEMAAARAEFMAIRASRSWRITAPVRAAGEIIRRRRNAAMPAGPANG